jgi:hypothetical protein
LPGAAWANLQLLPELINWRLFMEPEEHLAAAVRSVTKAEEATAYGIDAGERYDDEQGKGHVHHLPIKELRETCPSID